MTLLIDTAVVPAPQRVDFWSQSSSDVYHPVAIRADPALGAVSGRTNFHAGGAKDATTKIKCNRFAGRARNCFGGTHGDTNIAAVVAFSGIHFQRAAVAVGQRWCRTFGIGHCFATAF